MGCCPALRLLLLSQVGKLLSFFLPLAGEEGWHPDRNLQGLTKGCFNFFPLQFSQLKGRGGSRFFSLKFFLRTGWHYLLKAGLNSSVSLLLFVLDWD